MNPRVPDPPRLPDRMPERGSFVVPLALNLGLMLALYLATADASATAGAHSLEFLLALGGLALANTLATVVAALAGYSRTAMGFGLSILLVFLVGLGSCALVLQGS